MKNIKRVAKTVGTLGLVGCAVMTSPYALAEDSGWYVGLNIGESRARIDDARIVEQLRAASLTTTSISNDYRDTGYKIFGGYLYNKNFAVEAGYFDLGQFGYTATTLPAGTQTGKIKLKGLNLDAVGMLPISGKFSAFGRIGINYAEARDSFTSTGFVPVAAEPNPSKSEVNYKAGVGIQYDFNESLGMRLEGERYRINDAVGNRGDVDLYSLGLVYRFGEKKKPAPAPAPQAAAPARVVAAAPVFVVVPVKVRTAQYCTFLDIQFEIKQNEVQREDKEKLAVVGTFMNKYPDTTAVIEGHSDDVGTSEFNMKLSQERAEAVVNFLVDDQHIDASRLMAVGYGETRPIADNSTKEGKQANRRIDAVIACATDVAGLKVAPARITMAMEMEFDPYKSDVDPKSYDGLREVAKFMKANPAVTATVEGHANKYLGEGSDKLKTDPEVAMKISQLRAQKVVDYLVNNEGISRSRLSSEGYGHSGRVAYGTTLEGQQENRRVNIIINYPAR